MNPNDVLAECEGLVRNGRVAEAEPRLQSIASEPDVGREARRLLGVCRQLRRWGLLENVVAFGEASDASLADDDRRKVLISRNDSSARVLFVFTGKAAQMWVSIGLIHQVFSKLPWNIVYLGDPGKRVGYGYGLPQLGSGFRGTTAGMKRLVRELGGGKVFCIGSSAGGFAALRYGLEIGAAGVLLLSPTATNARDHRPDQKRGNSQTEIKAAGGFFSDIRKTYQGHTRLPRVHVIFGADNVADADTARHIQDLPGVTLEAIEGFAGHDVIAELILRDELHPRINDLWNYGRVDARQP